MGGVRCAGPRVLSPRWCGLGGPTRCSGQRHGFGAGFETEPGVKGDTASGGGTKAATLESGVTVQVPLFVEEGETIRVDTRSGDYVSWA